MLKVVKGLFAKVLDASGNSDPIDEQILRAYRSSHEIAESGYLRTDLTGSLVSEFVNGVEMTFNPRWPALSKVELKEPVRQKVEVMKHLTYEMIIMSSRLKLVEYRGLEVVDSLFRALENTNNRGHQLLPSDRRSLHDAFTSTDDKKRTISDFIAGMTDNYALEFHSRIKGTGLSIFKPF